MMFSFFFYYDHNYSFSINAAAPIPVAVHIEITPYFFFYLLSSGKSVATYLAPVHPRGCPKAIAPPFGLIVF
jgi:hypothetical protein